MPTDTAHGYQALSSREKARLAGILSRLASSFDNERAAAGLLATAFIDKHGLTWPEVIDALQPVRPTPPPQIDPPASRGRRRGGDKGWRGYCRRRSVRRGAALDVAS
jgi:hypothetical protein